MTELLARLLSGVVEIFWSKKLLKLSVACNVALGALLLLVVVYSYAVAPQTEASELQRRSERSLAADSTDVIPNPGETTLQAATPELAGVPPGWVSIPLSPSYGYGLMVAGLGNSQIVHVFKREDPQEPTLQKLTPVVVAALEMTPAEVSAIEALASRAATKVGTPGGVSGTFEYVPPVQRSNEELDVVSQEFVNGCTTILGETRGTALADATLMSSSFLARAYPNLSESFRFREETRRRREQLARVAKPEKLYNRYIQTLRIDAASDGSFTTTTTDHFQALDRAVIHSVEEDSK